MSQKVCFICKVPVSNKVKSATCNNLTCQHEYMIQHDEWKKAEMDYLYGITYKLTKEEDE